MTYGGGQRNRGSAVPLIVLFGVLLVTIVTAADAIGDGAPEDPAETEVLGVQLQRPTNVYAPKPADVTSANYFGPDRVDCAAAPTDALPPVCTARGA